MYNFEESYADLILACEDFSQEDFEKYHCFYKYENNIIDQLMAHGPVLLKGGRGAGKSALLREADRRLKSQNSRACGIYLSLRHLPLLRSQGKQYEDEFLRILIDRIKEVALKEYSYDFACEVEVYAVHKAIMEFSEKINKRIVLLLDDAAHIGREAGLEEFFSIFRTLSSSCVSCKAAIYPGVTKFGARFDVYNDAKVIDISRRFGQSGFQDFFYEVMKLRYPNRVDDKNIFGSLSAMEVANFLGMAVLGNVRSYIRGCSLIFEKEEKVTFLNLNSVFLELASNFYWPMLEEIRAKIGIYEPLIDCCMDIAEIIFNECGVKKATSFIIHRNLANKFSKPLEILEYAGFISKREASRGMKQGGRGVRYAVNLCNTLEKVEGARLTKSLYEEWVNVKVEDIQFAANNTAFAEKILPNVDFENNLGILDSDIEILKKSKVFPYGLTDDKIERLKSEGYCTVGKLAECTEADLRKIHRIGDWTVERIKNVVDQAIWM
ncbi:MAG: ATP-binding protein [Lachnospiraceae bacterium]|nr:ATP-binding protein [Lachnospiraceae bacterium]